MAAETEDYEKQKDIWIAGVLKAEGSNLSKSGEIGKLIPFVITEDEMHEFELPEVPGGTEAVPNPFVPTPKKRKREEIADSDSEGESLFESDEDYGWGEADEEATQQIVEETLQEVEEAGSDIVPNYGRNE